MAKRHTRKKGKSGSTKPIRTEAPAWSLTDADEITKVVLDMWKQGNSTSEIGMSPHLRILSSNSINYKPEIPRCPSESARTSS